MKLLNDIGSYLLLMHRVFRRPEKWNHFYKQIINEITYLGVDSMGIVLIISIFIGAVLVMQTAYNTDSPFIPKYTIGFITRQTIILEFAPTIISLILAGKVGSRIAGEIGTMRVTEQVDALEAMGINSASYLILPKIIACFVFFPVLVLFSMVFGLIGGYFVAMLSAEVTVETYMYGIRSFFIPYEIFYAIVKCLVFSFIITSVSGFFGYKVEGGALEVGNASTKAVVQSSILIIFFNVILTQLLL